MLEQDLPHQRQAEALAVALGGEEMSRIVIRGDSGFCLDAIMPFTSVCLSLRARYIV